MWLGINSWLIMGVPAGYLLVNDGDHTSEAAPRSYEGMTKD